MEKPKIIKITYSEEIPEKSAILLYRMMERLIIESLPSDPYLMGLFLQNSLEEFSSKHEKEGL